MHGPAPPRAMIAAAPLILIVTTTSFLASNVPIPLTIRRTAPGSSMATYVMSETESGDGAAPSLRDQMQAYLKSVQERGVELTAEQKAMIAEFEETMNYLTKRASRTLTRVPM